MGFAGTAQRICNNSAGEGRERRRGISTMPQLPLRTPLLQINYEDGADRIRKINKEKAKRERDRSETRKGRKRNGKGEKVCGKGNTRKMKENVFLFYYSSPLHYLCNVLPACATRWRRRNNPETHDLHF